MNKPCLPAFAALLAAAILLSSCQSAGPARDSRSLAEKVVGELGSSLAAASREGQASRRLAVPALGDLEIEAIKEAALARVEAEGWGNSSYLDKIAAPALEGVAAEVARVRGGAMGSDISAVMAVAAASFIVSAACEGRQGNTSDAAIRTDDVMGIAAAAALRQCDSLLSPAGALKAAVARESIGALESAATVGGASSSCAIQKMVAGFVEATEAWPEDLKAVLYFAAQAADRLSDPKKPFPGYSFAGDIAKAASMAVLACKDEIPAGGSPCGMLGCVAAELSCALPLSSAQIAGAVKATAAGASLAVDADAIVGESSPTATASAGPAAACAGGSRVTLSAGQSTGGYGFSALYEWSCLSGAAVIDNHCAATTTATIPPGESCVFQLVVKNAAGLKTAYATTGVASTPSAAGARSDAPPLEAAVARR